MLSLRLRSRRADPPEDEPPVLAARTTAQRVYLVLFAAIVGVLVVAILWIVITGLVARSRLERVKGELRDLRSSISHGDLDSARRLSARIGEQTGDAHQLTSGPAWWVGANIPFVGTPLRTVRIVAYQSDLIGRATLSLTHSAGQFEATRRTETAIDVSKLDTLVRSLHGATDTVQAAARQVRASAPSWLPLVSGGRADFLAALGRIDPPLVQADRTAQAIIPLLDQTRPQRYFVGFMNEAESRGLGGLPGAFAIVTADRGRLSVTHFGNDPEFHRVRSGVDLGAEYNARYGTATPADYYANSDISPDLRDAGRIWAGMWHKVSGQHVDGALMIDPNTLAYLLAAVGPATLPDGTEASAANVVPLTEKDQYSKYASDARRNAYLTQIAEAVTARLTEKVGSHLGAVLGAVEHGIRERRVGIWSADPTIETKIIDAGYGAVLQPTDAFTGFTVVNAAGSKLDYYLKRRMTYVRSSCAAGATATATFTLDNDAPRSGLPAYVTERADDHPADVHPGDNRLLVTYYASSGATIDAVFVDGVRLIVASAPEHGLVAATIDLELPVQAKRTIMVRVREPRATQPLTVLRQPLVQSMTSKIDQHCGP